ncbi:copper resistance CopC/CopD family protein [Bacillus sp. V5-8f]|uniref:copper resistance CopC/CopD family protein n=1 Tax=Bacillus sp. V5-8f TaxID=2053044 RepID=UPI000C764B68|nr:copper resistance protein CopC [Bacillus sp. V5-8f]PLT32005.1 hypothetical protein CUU64_20695 [Bacillus sp. V5-8f]
MQRPLILLIIMICLFLFPRHIFAHTVLIEGSPSADSRLEESPNSVTLSFNEKIKKGLFSLKVVNQNQEIISKGNPRLSKDQRKIQIMIPKLYDGAYLVTYKIVSADGHPVNGSYVFLVGEAQYPQNSDWDQSENITFQLEVYLTRAVYYLSLLGLTGWVFWGLFQTDGHSVQLQKKYRFTVLILQQMQLLSLLILITTQWLMASKTADIPINTVFGVSWLISLVLSLLGFIILFRSKWLDSVWVILMLTAKSFNGHAISYGPEWVSIPLTFLHLLFASIWVGGLLYIIVFWRKHRLHVKEYLSLFSTVAFKGMIILFISGAFTTFFFLPQVNYLWITPWGKLLLAKIILILMVIATAFKIRGTIKNKSFTDAWHWLKIDFSMMLMITLIVGGLSYISPIPANTPLEWTANVAKGAMTLTITPRAPGKNQFSINFKKNTVKTVELWLFYKENEEIAPIQVPLKSTTRNRSFLAEGYYLPFPGEWLAEVRVIDNKGEEFILQKSFRIFETVKIEST